MYKINFKRSKNIEKRHTASSTLYTSFADPYLYLLSRYSIILLTPFLPRGFICLFIWYDKKHTSQRSCSLFPVFLSPVPAGSNRCWYWALWPYTIRPTKTDSWNVSCFRLYDVPRTLELTFWKCCYKKNLSITKLFLLINGPLILSNTQ